MPAHGHNRFCPLSMALDVLGDPWSLLVVRALMFGPRVRKSLSQFLTGLDDGELEDVLRRLLDANIIGCEAADPDVRDATFELTDRGASLGPVVTELTRWGLSELLMTEPGCEPRPDRDSFDQTWAIAGMADPADEVYAWTIDGKTFALEVAGATLTRSIGTPTKPAATLESSSRVLDAIVFGEMAVSEALMRGELKLTGATETIRRMFHVVGFPPELLDATSAQ